MPPGKNWRHYFHKRIMNPHNLLFKNNQLAETFLEHGYVVLRGYFTSEMELLRQTIQHFSPPQTHTFFYSLLHYSLNTNQEIRTEIKQVLTTAYDSLFYNYKTRNESFLIKPAGMNEELYLHQDWSYTNIRNYHTATLWIPLIETNSTNGALYFLKKSHQKFPAFISATLPTTRLPRTSFSESCIESIFTHPGDAILFNPQIFHGSYANISQQSRPVVTSTIFPPDAPYLLPHKTAADEKLLIELEEDDFLSSLNQFAIGEVTLLNRKQQQLYADEPVSLNSILEAYK